MDIPENDFIKFEVNFFGAKEAGPENTVTLYIYDGQRIAIESIVYPVPASLLK